MYNYCTEVWDGFQCSQVDCQHLQGLIVLLSNPEEDCYRLTQVIGLVVVGLVPQEICEKHQKVNNFENVLKFIRNTFEHFV